MQEKEERLTTEEWEMIQKKREEKESSSQPKSNENLQPNSDNDDLKKEDFLGNSPQTQQMVEVSKSIPPATMNDDTYFCVSCRSVVQKGAALCPSCGEELVWEGL